MHPVLREPSAIAKEIAKFDRTKELEDSIRKMMFVAPIFKEYAHKMFIRCKGDHSLNSFDKKFTDSNFESLIYGLNSYIKNSGETHDIDLKTIITLIVVISYTTMVFTGIVEADYKDLVIMILTYYFAKKTDEIKK